MNEFFRRLKSTSSHFPGFAKSGGMKASSIMRRFSPAVSEIFDQYEEAMPSAQNAVDLLPGWNTALPASCAAQAGALALYQDERMIWASERFGSLEGAEVLELGPLEAGHTLYLEGKGASVLGIEANKLAFLKCLVAKEISGMTRARFMLGDFLKWMEREERTYDLVVASGVLYHMRDPLRLLELITRRGRAIYLWTHYLSDEAMPIGDPRRNIMARHPEVVQFHGQPMRLYTRTYNNAQSDSAFSGGMADQHKWMHRDDILAALRVLGATDIEVAHENHAHRNGPCFSVFARVPGAG